MDIFEFFQDLFIFALCGAIIIIVLLYISDGDLTLMFYDRFGSPVEDMAGDVVWITGASTGIGEALAIRLAQAGCKLVLSARREELLEKTKRECLKLGTLESHDILVLPMDVTEMSKHQQHFQKVLDHFGKLDVLVNNAGRSQRSRWDEIDIEVDRQIFELNVFSVVSLSRVVVPYFIKNNKGHIAVTSSTAGKLGAPFSGSYTATKHALHGYFEALRIESVGSNLHLTMLCPGPVFSDALKEAFTGAPGEKFGEEWKAGDKRMTSARCAHLFAVAIRNKLDEAFISLNPVLILMILYQYMPTITRRILTSKLISGKSAAFIQKVRDNRETVSAKDK
jgi:dehydrogenase/reductase SDR family protein 7